MQNLYETDIKKYYEKQSVKHAANLTGAAYCVMSVLSILLQAAASVSFLSFFGISRTLALFADANFVMLLQIVLSTVVFTLPFIFVAKVGGCKASSLAVFTRPKRGLFWPLVGIGIGVCGVAEIPAQIFMETLAAFGIQPSAPALETDSSAFGVLLAVLGIAVFPALVEEFAMRGITMGFLRPQGDSYAILISSVMFALMHANLVQIPFAFIAGLGLGFVAVKSGSVWTACLVHFINNLTSTALDYLSNCMSEAAVSAVCIAVNIAYILIGILALSVAERRDSDLLRFEKSETVSKFSEKVKWFFLSPFVIIAIVITVIEIIIF